MIFMKREILDLIPMFGIYLQRHFITLELLNKQKDFILDVGCGDGFMSSFFKKCGKKIIAIDLVKTKRNFPYVIARAENLPFKKNTFEQILCLDVLEHIKHDKLVVEEIERVLKVNGNLILTVPSKFWRFPYYSFMRFVSPSEKFLLKFFGHVKKGYDTNQIRKLFTKLKIEKVKYYCDKISALFYDLEYSNLFIIKNIILRILALPLYINFKLSKKDFGTNIGVRLVKTR